MSSWFSQGHISDGTKDDVVVDALELGENSTSPRAIFRKVPELPPENRQGHQPGRSEEASQPRGPGAWGLKEGGIGEARGREGPWTGARA